MTRGNQREVDRLRALQRSKKSAQDKKTVGNPLAKKEADAKALQDKVAKKKAAEMNNGKT